VENWKCPYRILVILAHPDDPEFFCGATIARWADEGHDVGYWLLTCGDKGASDPSVVPKDLCHIRHAEQLAAARKLGVHRVNFLDYPDGHLVPDMKLRGEITRIIRLEKPDILVSCDPNTLFVGNSRINHPDHRAAGQVVLDAVFPAAGNPLYFPELIQKEGLLPHQVKEVWLAGTSEPNEIIDVTGLWNKKIRALYEHKSQIGDKDAFTERMRARFTEESTMENPRYEERFRRIVFE